MNSMVCLSSSRWQTWPVSVYSKPAQRWPCYRLDPSGHQPWSKNAASWANTGSFKWGNVADVPAHPQPVKLHLCVPRACEMCSFQTHKNNSAVSFWWVGWGTTVWSYSRPAKTLCEAESAVSRKAVCFPKPLLYACVRPTSAIMICIALPGFLTSLWVRDEDLAYFVGFATANGNELITWILTMSYLFLFAGCGRNFTSPEGLIVSPNYPGQYDNNLNCSYIIDQGPQSLVILEFETFHLEGNWFFIISVCAMNVTSYLKTFKSSVIENGWWLTLLVHSKNCLLANIYRESVHGVSFVSVKASRTTKIEYLTCWGASCSNEAGNLPDG